MAAFEFTPELSPEEEAHYDRLIETGVANPHDAYELVRLERPRQQAKLGSGAVPRVVDAPEAKALKKARRRNTRGGRAYPEPSDSELDPYWNVSTKDTDNQLAIFEDSEETKAIKEQLANDSRADTIRAMMLHEGLTELEATARYMARQQIRNRRS